MLNNIKDFGATGDGKTDDRASIQQAINDAVGKNKGGILIPAGIYRVSKSGAPGEKWSLYLSGVEDFAIVGEGPKSVVKLVDTTKATGIKYPLVIWHYAQGMAMLAQNNRSNAKTHLAEMKAIMADTTMKDLSIWGINSVFDLCVIASTTLGGEICAKEKDFPKAIALLKEAVAKEDALNYNEPPDWFFSVRHHLGAVLLEAGKFQDAAVNVYEEDLKVYRENGWALKGLMNAFEKLGDKKRYDKTKLRFDEAWKNADINIGASRIL